jgi:cellulose synthase/poly-beta-1,6-N-acetylglucosamine synthase-like glycosyltransferase
LCNSVAFLADYHFSKAFLSAATRHSIINGTTAACELLAHGRISEDAYYRTLADRHGVAFREPEDIDQALLGRGNHSIGRQGAWCRTSVNCVEPVYAPDPAQPGIGGRRAVDGLKDAVPLAMTTRTALRKALTNRTRDHLAQDASEKLATASPEHSAKFGAGSWHGLVLGGVAAGGAAALIAFTGHALLTIHALLSTFFLACVGLRLIAALSYRRTPPTPLRHYPNADRPVYSVVVPLNREAPVVPDLVRSLKKLQWPRSKLEIKIVCEEGDRETLDALASEKLDWRFEVLTTPLIGPQTKPKALNFALPFCSGQLITLYDAEDRPHPEQLEEAWQVFRIADKQLGALQAPLVIANPRNNLITAMFHLEFAALFHGILQWLARHELPIPLGGTSTHFRRAAIEESGGWDSYNVTEDADLGFRMWRAGYRIGLLTRPTYEDAPGSIPVWLRQRTRWIKGWMQTWIVRTRRVRAPRSGKHLAGAGIMHVMLAGNVISSLFYPFTVLTVSALAATSALGIPLSPEYRWLAALDWTNIVGSFAVYALLCMRTVDPRLRTLSFGALLATPAYWLLGSFAGWRAAVQYFREPFLWEKTPHAAHDPKGDFHHLT